MRGVLPDNVLKWTHMGTGRHTAFAVRRPIWARVNLGREFFYLIISGQAWGLNPPNIILPSYVTQVTGGGASPLSPPAMRGRLLTASSKLSRPLRFRYMPLQRVLQGRMHPATGPFENSKVEACAHALRLNSAPSFVTIFIIPYGIYVGFCCN